jgi:hypothetical protein
MQRSIQVAKQSRNSNSEVRTDITMSVQKIEQIQKAAADIRTAGKRNNGEEVFRLANHAKAVVESLQIPKNESIIAAQVLSHLAEALMDAGAWVLAEEWYLEACNYAARFAPRDPATAWDLCYYAQCLVVNGKKTAARMQISNARKVLMMAAMSDSELEENLVKLSNACNNA